MTPPKTLDAQIDAVIENDIRFWIEETKEQEAVQESFEFEENE